MKKIKFIQLLSIIIFATYTISVNAQSSKQQKFIFPEKLWKIHCEGMASNIIFQNLPMDIAVSINDANSGEGILQGDIFDMDKGYNNSPYYFSKGKFLIKPCSGSNEENIEISSSGLHFIYHHGIGLEYVSGKGDIKMFGKNYELPVDEWKIALKDSTIIGYRNYIENNPAGEHYQDAISKIEEISYQACLKKDRYYGYNKFITEYPNSKYLNEIKNKLTSFKVITFNKDTILTETNLVNKYHWDKQYNMQITDDKTIEMQVDGNGRNWASSNFAFGNIEFINTRLTRVDNGIYIVKGTTLIYKVIPKINTQPKQSIKTPKK